MEISSLTEFPKEQIEFIESVSETIAGTIQNVKNTEQTKKLLEDSQQLTEQMRAQEEEIARKEQITANTIKAFEQAVATIEFDKDGVITNINDSFCKLYQKPKNSLLGKNLNSILDISDGSISSIVSDVFANNTTINHTLDLIMDQGTIAINAYVSPLQSNNAIIIGYENANSSTGLDGEIIQHLEMLHKTKKVLSEKSQALNQRLCYLEVDSNMVIVNHNLRAEALLGINIKGKNISKIPETNTTGISDSLTKEDTYQKLLSLENKEKILLQIEKINT